MHRQLERTATDHDLRRVPVGVGPYLSANLLYHSSKLRRPSAGSAAVVWLHPYAYNNGSAHRAVGPGS
jgi:hypothetical protein